jgi:hypothetical protein
MMCSITRCLLYPLSLKEKKQKHIHRLIWLNFMIDVNESHNKLSFRARLLKLCFVPFIFSS